MGLLLEPKRVTEWSDPDVRPGVRQMMDAIHSEGKERGAVQDFDGVALIHAEVQIKEHRSVQVAVARYCEKLGDRGVVIVHNSGQEVTHGHREECLEWLNVLPNASDKGMLVVATTDHPRLKARHQHWRGRAVHLANANPASPLYGPQLQIPATTAGHP